MARNFRCKSCLQEKVYIIPFQSRVNRHVCDVIYIYDKRYFQLSTGDVIMNIAVSFSLRFKHVIREFLKRAVLYLQSNHILNHFSNIFLLLNDLFTLINICSICLVLKTR